VYSPPFNEFNVMVTILGSNESAKIRALKGPSIMINVKGHGKMRTAGKEYLLGEGYIYFVGQGVETTFQSENEMQIYRAYVE